MTASATALPYDGDSHLLFYNKEILDRNGVAVPTTWEEYLAAIKKITEGGIEERHLWRGGARRQGADHHRLQLRQPPRRLRSGKFLNEDGSSALDSPAALEAAKALVETNPCALPTPLETRFRRGLARLPRRQGRGFVEFWSDLGVYAQDPGKARRSSTNGASRASRSAAPSARTAPAPQCRLRLRGLFGLAEEGSRLGTDQVRGEPEVPGGSWILLTGSGIDPDRTSLALFREVQGLRAPRRCRRRSPVRWKRAALADHRPETPKLAADAGRRAGAGAGRLQDAANRRSRMRTRPGRDHRLPGAGFVMICARPLQGLTLRAGGFVIAGVRGAMMTATALPTVALGRTGFLASRGSASAPGSRRRLDVRLGAASDDTSVDDLAHPAGGRSRTSTDRHGAGSTASASISRKSWSARRSLPYFRGRVGHQAGGEPAATRCSAPAEQTRGYDLGWDRYGWRGIILIGGGGFGPFHWWGFGGWG